MKRLGRAILNFLRGSAYLARLVATDFMLEFTADDLDEIIPLPDTGAQDIVWVLGVDDVRAMIALAHAEPDPEMALLSILAHSDLEDDEAA